MVPIYYTKEVCGSHVNHIGGDNNALPWSHVLSLPIGLRREHTLIKDEDLRLGQQIHAQLLSSNGRLSPYSKLSGSIEELF